MDQVRVNVDWLEDYAALLDRHADEAGTTLTSLRSHGLSDEAFGDVGQEMGTPRSYQRAAESLYTQLGRAEEVLSAAAAALREVSEHYQGTDLDGALGLTKKAGDTDATR
ncbi:MAG TPA: hypothetical protein VGD67_08375 [Pseudonocardiaceae bacterium]